MENVLTLGKLLSLWFCFPPFYFVFDISNLLSYIQNISSNELACPVMGTIFLVIITFVWFVAKQHINFKIIFDV